jgi:hypothetical protein
VYYEYELTRPHNLISAAVTDGQLYILNASAAGPGHTVLVFSTGLYNIHRTPRRSAW